MTMFAKSSSTAGVAVALGVLSTVWMGSSGQAQEKTTVDNLYTGLSGQEFVFNGAADSGTLQNGLMNTVLAEFEKKTGAKIQFDSFCCGIAKLQAMQQSDNVTWTVVQFSTVTDLRLAQKNNLLEELDPSVIPLHLLEEGGYDENAIYGYPYATVIAWDTRTWPMTGKHPTMIEDVFNTTDFPGKRCLYKYPQFGGTLEAALLAAGVAPDKLYPLDVKKAYESLNKLRDDIVWFSTGSQGVQQLVSGACQIALVWNGPAAEIIRQDEAPIGMAWGHAIWNYTPVTIPKGVKDLKAAQGILRLMITDRKVQEEFVKQTAYLLTPLKEQVAIPEDLKPWVLAGENRKNAILEDDDYYAENIEALLKQFNSWVVTGKAE
jgi:putative spermidine/putrescine transport system substrate-binding protein